MTAPKHSVTLCLLFALGCASSSSDAPPPQPPSETTDAATQSVSPIPEGYFSLTPQLAVTDVDAAADFYTKAFGAEKKSSIPGPDGKTLHAELKLGDSIVMLDAEGGSLRAPTTLGGSPASIMLYVPNVDEVYQAALDAGAQPQLPPTDQFWGDRYGELVDPAGHRWGIATHTEDLTPEQMQQRAELAMADMPAPEGDDRTDKKGDKKAAKKADKKGDKKADKKAAKKADKKGDKGAPPEPKWKSVAAAAAKNPIPPEYHSVTPMLTTSDAASAIEFYKQAFGATERNRMPMPNGKLMHAEVQIGDSVLMLSDEFPAPDAPKSAKTIGGSPVMLHLYVPNADQTFQAATESGAQVLDPIADAFWGDRYAAVVDPAGFPWGIATHIEDLTPEEMAKRAQEAMSAGAEPSAHSPEGG